MGRTQSKLIFYILTGFMGIGMITFSFSVPKQTQTSEEVTHVNSSSNISEHQENTSLPVSPTASLTQPPVLLPANELVLCQDSDVIQVINDFYHAKLTCAAEDFAPILLNVNQLDMERLQKKIEYVEDYQNIKCYTKKGINEIDLVVYVCYDLKLTTIDTLAPSIDELLVTYKDQKPYIFMGSISEESASYLDSLRIEEDVELLVSDVLKQLEIACTKDSDLNDFYKNITSSKESEQK